ncbi:MAG: HRDC domain-containing protein, partial [Candidatus Kapaibacterium sp.]
FEFARILRFEPAAGSGGIVLLQPRAVRDRMEFDRDALDLRRRRAMEKLDDVVRYMETRDCKRNVLLRYFDDEVTTVCGRCSSCMAGPVSTPPSAAEQEEVELEVLRTVAELGERFGRTTIAAVLVGEETTTVRRFLLDRSRSFARLKQRSSSSVIETIDDLIRTRMLTNGTGDRPTVSLSRRGRERLGTDVPARLPMNVRREETGTEDAAETDRIIERLKRVRTDLASRTGVPARTILSEEQLRAFASNRPASIQECALIRGIGRMFLERYAREFLAVVRESDREVAETEAEESLAPEQRRMLSLVREGCSVQDIAQRLRITPGAVAAGVQDLVMSGIPMPHAGLVSDEVLVRVRRELQRNPRAYLKELRAAIGAEVTPAELRIAGAFVRREHERALRY